MILQDLTLNKLIDPYGIYEFKIYGFGLGLKIMIRLGSDLL